MYLPGSIPTFVELLKNRGFQTAAFIDDNPFACSLLGYNRGFDFVRDYFAESLRTRANDEALPVADIRKLMPSAASAILHALSSSPFPYFIKYLTSTALVQPRTNTEQIIPDAIKFLKSTKSSSFVWLHLMDTHWPFSFPPRRNPLAKYKILRARGMYSEIPGKHTYSAEIGELMEEMYDTSVRRLDIKLESLFNSLRREGILENSYVFLTSDHGEEFLERGALDHQENVYQEVAHVPLIVRQPEAEKRAISEKMVSLLDIAPTILQLENVSVPSRYEGTSIFQGNRGYCISETVTPTVNKSAQTREAHYRAPLGNFIYSIRNGKYTIIYDKDGEYKFFNRIEDAQEKKQIQVSNSTLHDLLGILRKHQSCSPNVEMKRIKERIGRLKFDVSAK